MIPSELLNQMKIDKHLKYTQYLVIAGSHAYGTTVESSDVDVRGWYFPPISDILGIHQKASDSYLYPDSDVVLYTFHKFVHLLAQCNSNVVEQVGVDDVCILYQSNAAARIVNNLDLFLSKRVFQSFGGYANTMLKRFEQSDTEDVTMCHRNRKRVESKKWKHLMHLIRLLYMGIDILKHHQVVTHRVKEHDLLMSIRHGEVDVKYVFRLRDKLEVQLQEAYDTTTLPERADIEQINILVSGITLNYISDQKEHETNWKNIKGVE